MNILYVGRSSSWHIDLWVKYFVQNHRVYLFADKEKYLEDQRFDKVEIISSSGCFGGILNKCGSRSHLLFQMNKWFSTRYFARKIERIIEKYQIDIVHAHSLYYGYITSFVKTDKPIVFTPMGSDVIIHAQENVIYRHMAKKAFSRANIITGDSLLLQSSGYKVGAQPRRNHIIQNGVDGTTFYPRQNNIREDYKVEAKETLIFSPRAITPLYNIDTILDALAHLKKANYHFKCMFSFAFGDEYSAEMKRKIRSLSLDEYIIWLGYLSYENMATHYNAADIILSVPSSDSSPKSVYEAMFCGKPVIISDLEWSYEHLESSDCIRVEARNSLQLSKAIRRLIDDVELAKELGSNALLTAREHFDYLANMKEMEKIMIQALEESNH